MNDPRPWRKHNVVEFYDDEVVEDLDLEQLGALGLLMDRLWRRGDLRRDKALQLLAQRGATDAETVFGAIESKFAPAPHDPERIVCPELEEERAEADEKSAKASKAAKARHAKWLKQQEVKRAASGRSADAQQDAQPVRNGTERDGTERDEDGSSSAPGRRGKPRPETWERVLERDEFTELRDSVPFRAAWDEWVEHAGQADTKAKVPKGARATRCFRDAVEAGVERYVEAIRLAIRNNYQGVNPAWVNTGAKLNGHDPIDAAVREWGICR